MYENQPLDLFWDSSSVLDTATASTLRKGGFSALPISLSEISDRSISQEKTPKIVCVQGFSGMQAPHIKRIRELLGPSAYLIFRVENNDFETALLAARCGVDDVVTKDADSVKWEKVASSARLRLLKFESYVFVDETSQNLLALVERVGASDVTALLQGPTGSGKEILARLTHDFSPRRDGPFVPVNCAALPEDLAESLLFGHLKGSFTGAARNTEGFFKQANSGTLFLDEIGELTPQLQAKLLRAIQEKEILPVGSSESQKVDVRIVSATNRNLRDPRFNNGFREDLYFRISTFRINVPSLRTRLDDVLPLANFFILKHSSENSSIQFSPEAIAKLLAYQWPGNVRELENVIQRAIVLSNGIEIESKHLIFDEPNFGYSGMEDIAGLDQNYDSISPTDGGINDRSDEPLQDALEANEFRIIAETVKAAPTKQAAAKQLGISERTLRYKMAKMRERGFAPQRKIA